MNLFTLNEVKAVYSRKERASDRPKITCSRDCYNLVYPSWMESVDHYESFKVMMLDRGNNVLGIAPLFIGGIAGVQIDVKRIFQTALVCNASSIILMHNHPSGTLQASDADIKITKKVKAAGEILDISVFDHLIFTSESYLSMADDGLMH